LSRKCETLDISQTYGPSWSVTGIALPLPSKEYAAIKLVPLNVSVSYEYIGEERVFTQIMESFVYCKTM
jgi:hypothetical protein